MPIWGEGEGHDLVAQIVGPERHRDELQRHSDPQRVLRAAGQNALQAQLTGELDDPHEPRLETLRRHELAGERGLGHKSLRSPRPQRASPAEQLPFQIDGAAPGTPRSPWERHRPAARAPSPDESRLVRRPGEEALGDRYRRHAILQN
jgi:hypothetical protein